MRRRSACVSVAGLLMAASLASASTGRLIAIDGDRRLYEIDPVTAAGTLLGTVTLSPSGTAPTTASLAYDCAGGRIFMTSTNTDRLLLLDLNTRVATSIGSLGASSLNMQGMEWDSSINSLWGGNNGQLFSINPATGASAQVGASGFLSFLNLGHDSRNNVLYGTLSNTSSLYNVNRSNGALTLIGALGEAASPHALTYNKDNGVMYLIESGSSSLFHLDTATGVAHRIGRLPIDFLGLTYIPDVCGESTLPGCAGYATPYTSVGGTTQTITVYAHPVLSPPSGDMAVAGDFSVVGGSSTQLFTAGANNYFTYNLSIPANQPPGTYIIPIRVTDSQGRINSSAVAVRVRPSAAQGYVTETEPNDVKEAANAFVLANGQGITGRTLGPFTEPGDSSVDYFKITTTPAPLAIYRHRLIPESPLLEQVIQLRGLSQSGGVVSTTDDVVATSSAATTPPRFMQWYGFGKSESVYVRLSGNVSTTFEYDIALETTGVTPTLATTTFAPGPITIARTSGTTAMGLVVYTAAGEPVDDFVFQGSSTVSSIVRTLPAGQYYLAISNTNVVDNRPTPADSATPTGNPPQWNRVLDFPHAIANTSTLATATIPFSISDGVNTESFSFSKNEPFKVMFVRFTVGSPTLDVICCRGTTCAVVPSAADCTVPASPIVGAVVSPATNCGQTNNAVTGCCYANFNKDAATNIDDIFIYLNAWFGSSPYTNVDGNGADVPNIDDIFIFLNMWFQGC